MSDAFWQMLGVAITAMAPVIIMLLSQNRRARAEAIKAKQDREALLSKMNETANFMNTVAVNTNAFKDALIHKRASGFGELDP